MIDDNEYRKNQNPLWNTLNTFDDNIKSKERVKTLGEVFTPLWTIDKMLMMLPEDSFHPQTTVLEPSVGDGRFLCRMFEMKAMRLDKNLPNDKYNDLLLDILRSLYGVELMEDNLNRARLNLLAFFWEYRKSTKYWMALKSKALGIIKKNIQQGNFLTQKNNKGYTIWFLHQEPLDFNLLPKIRRKRK